jgi:hypothetical protein
MIGDASVHVDVEEAGLGVGNLRQRLAVDPRQLQEGDQREAGGQHRRDPAQRLHVLLGQRVELVLGEAHAEPDAFDQLGLQAGLLGRVSQREDPLSRREQVLEQAVGEPAVPGRLLDLSERVTAFAQSRDHPGERGGGRRPAVGRHALAVRYDPGLDPAPKGRGSHAHAGRYLTRAQAFLVQVPGHVDELDSRDR